MAKLVLTPSPTFMANVLIPVPGKKPVSVEFKFRGRTKSEFRELLERIGEMEDTQAIMEIAAGWELDEPFDAENVETMVQNYIGSAKAVIEKYINELSNARLGN